tara:strand:- start:6002 stop:6379 length:378 start_codon:yes stop_codon:yes gene_type:complete
MNRFLELVEENTPDLNLDERIAAKRAVQRCLMDNDIRCDADQKSDNVIIHLPDGRAVNLEVIDFIDTEDNEMDDMAAAELAMGAAEKFKAVANPKSRGAKKMDKSISNLVTVVSNKINKIAKSIK